MNRAPAVTLAWLGVLLLAAVGLTVATFYAFIVPDDRHMTFFSVVVSTCLAEVVLFGYVAYLLTVPHTVTRPSPAVRMRILAVVVVWFLLVLVSGSVAVRPALADTFFSDKIIVLQAILTFLLLLGAFFLHRQDVVIQMRDEVPQQQQRVRMQSFAGGVDALLVSLRSLAGAHPERATDVERLAKRVDTLKSQLMAVSPLTERDMGRQVEPVSDEDIVQGLRRLHGAVEGLTGAGGDQWEPQWANVRREVDGLSALLRRREDVITF